MQIFFYCTAKDLQEIFSEIELSHSLVYEPRYTYAPRIIEIDALLRKPFYSYREFFQFGKNYNDTPPFYIYVPEDESRHIAPPNLLYFSGSPSSLKDDYVLCEGSLFLEPENKGEKPRSLYKDIRKIFSKRFVKSGYCFISPCVYANRREYLFVQRDHNFLAPAWYFNSAGQHTSIDIESWYQMQGKQREDYNMSSGKFLFFAAQEDLQTILLALEAKYNLKCVETLRQGKRELYVYAPTQRMLLYLEIDTSWNHNKKVAVVSKALEIQNAFGGQLYQDFIEKVKERFRTIKEQHYGPFYLGPRLYTYRHNIVLSLNDPYFRINENNEAVHIWRKEWNELLAQRELENKQV